MPKRQSWRETHTALEAGAYGHQGGRCAICHDFISLDKAEGDYDEEEVLRGMLCRPCSLNLELAERTAEMVGMSIDAYIARIGVYLRGEAALKAERSD